LNKIRKVAILGAGFTTNNMGVWALASGAISVVSKNFPEANVFMLDYYSHPEKYSIQSSHGSKTIQLVNIRFSKKIWLPNNIIRLIISALIIRVITNTKLKKMIVSNNNCFQDITSTNLFFAVSGGDSFSDIYGIGRFFYVCLPQLLVLLLRKPLILLPQTIGPFEGFIGKIISTYIIKNSNTVYSRELNEIKTLKNINRNASFCYDLGFILKPDLTSTKIIKIINQLPKKESIVGINVSGLLHIGGYTKDNMFGLGVDYNTLIKSIIELLIDKHKANILLIPHVTGGRKNLESDTQACKMIYHDLKPKFFPFLHFFNYNLNHQETKSIIGQCDFFIGSRMHACIAALSQSIPAIGLAYSKKFIGVYESIGMEKLVQDLRNCDNESIIKNIEKEYKNRNSTIDKLKSKMVDLEQSIFNSLRIQSINYRK
jgi:polysaccharide pyruvyl transferase WcaK-like protein